MANPTNPPSAPANVTPPVFALPIAQVQAGGIYATPSFMQFLTTLWAALVGTGGFADIAAFGAASITGQSTPADAGAGALALGGAGAPSGFSPADLLLCFAAGATMPAPGISAFPWLPPAPAASPIGDALTWTPTIAGSTAVGAQTYGRQFGRLVYCGPLVIALFDLALTALDGATAGNVTIAGLPVASAAAPAAIQGGWLSVFGGITLAAGATFLGAEAASGAKAVALIESASAAAPASLPVSALSNTTALRGGIVYFR